MKMHSKPVFSLLAVFTIAMTLGISNAFAEVATVSVPQGTSVPGCEATNECYIPYEITINVGEEVTWSNDDSAAHTVTAGSAADGPSGAFDSSLFMAATTFSHTFEEAGTFPYFCMVHPWMEGIVVVQEAGAEEDDNMMEGELMVTVMDSAVKGGTQIDLEFSELHVNYEITATQNGEVVLQETAHAMEMTASHMVDAVGSDENPIDVEIVSLGIGAPGEEDSWTGPVGTVATAKVVPEFGTVAMMILAVAIISIVAVTAKSRVIPRL